MRRTLYEWCAERGDDTLLRHWDKGKNGEITPETVTFGGHYKAFWHCDAGHSWRAAVYARTAGAGCPCYAGKKAAEGSDLAARFPEIAAEWHPTKNAPLTPADVPPGTHRKVWWRCEAVGHEWQAEIKSRTEGCGCPYCANRVVLAGFNDLATKDPGLATQWYQALNGPLTPQRKKI